MNHVSTAGEVHIRKNTSEVRDFQSSWQSLRWGKFRHDPYKAIKKDMKILTKIIFT